MVPWVDKRERELHGLRLQNDLGTKVLFVVLSVLALLLLAAIVASPARAELTGGAGGAADQVTEAAETTTASVIDDGTTVADEGAAGGEGAFTTPADQVVEEEISPVGDETVGVSENILSVGDNAVEVVIAALSEEVVLDDAGALIPPEDLLTEDLLTLDLASPVVEVVEGVSPFVIADEVRTVLADVVVMVPPEVVDVVRVLPLIVSPAVANPGPIEYPTVAVIPTINIAHESVLASPPVDAEAHQLSGLFAKELVTEMTLFHLTDLTVVSAAARSSASPAPERETAAMAAYVPVAGTMPVVGGAGASSSTGSSHAGSSSFGGVDAFSFFAAMAAWLALCLLGWIRDRSRSGRSIFPSHGGRPG